MITARQATGYTVTVTVTLTGTSGTMTVYRVDAEGQEVKLPAAVGVPAASGVWTDAEAPLGVPVTYEARLSSGIVYVSDPVTLTVPGGLPILSDPYRGLFAPVRVVTLDDDESHASRATALDIEGRASRIVLWDVEGAPRWQLQFMTHTEADQLTIDRIAATGDPVLLRTGCPGVPDAWLQRIGDRTVARWRKTGETRLHTWADCEVLPGTWRPGVRPVGDTLADLDVAVGGTTLGDIATRWATLLDIASEDLRSLA